MKSQQLTKVLTATAIAVGSLALGNSIARAQPTLQEERNFFCDVSSGTPKTMYRTTSGNQETWIEWRSDHFSAAGYDPLTRCQAVSDRLQTYMEERELQFITHGVMNGENVICTALAEGDPCHQLIYTLQPGRDPERTLNNVLAWNQGVAGVPPLLESAGSRPQIPQRSYIDVRERLEGSPETQATPATSDETEFDPETFLDNYRESFGN